MLRAVMLSSALLLPSRTVGCKSRLTVSLEDLWNTHASSRVVERGPALAYKCSEKSVVSLRGCSANLIEIEW